MESRKRPHMDDGDVSVAAKKRVLTGSNGTPHVNSTTDQTEDEQIFNAELEVSVRDHTLFLFGITSLSYRTQNFRKEAIYRRMKYYSRENERNVARIQDLERRKTSCEAGVAAISACWSQVRALAIVVQMLILLTLTLDSSLKPFGFSLTRTISTLRIFRAKVVFLSHML